MRPAAVGMNENPKCTHLPPHSVPSDVPASTVSPPSFPARPCRPPRAPMVMRPSATTVTVLQLGEQLWLSREVKFPFSTACHRCVCVCVLVAC